jgi:hypothetical protein
LGNYEVVTWSSLGFRMWRISMTSFPPKVVASPNSITKSISRRSLRGEPRRARPPVILAGDFNSNEKSSTVLWAALRSGKWHDAGAYLGCTEPTFHRNTQHMRIDYIICNAPALPLLQQFEKIPGSGLQRHDCLCARFNFELADQAKWVPSVPHPIDLSSFPRVDAYTEEALLTVSRILDPVEAAFFEALRLAVYNKHHGERALSAAANITRACEILSDAS